MRGEVWWALLDERRPVVLLASARQPEIPAVQIVAPATAAQRRGYTLLSGEQAAGRDAARIHAEAGGQDAGIEVGIDVGLPQSGVVRVALPRDGRVFCTWLVTLTPEHLIERVGVLPAPTLAHLDHALRLAGIG
jgi:mRNA interferase MazF